MDPLQPGDTAPALSLPRDGGDIWSLADAQGQIVVVFFYPRDDTPTCTTEAKDFSAAAADFAAAGAVVVGISKDSVRKHDKFRDKHDLSVVLLSDEHGTTCENFGVWGEKKLYGRTYLGIERSTFVIGTDGKIAAVWPKVSVKDHIQEVLATVRAM